MAIYDPDYDDPLLVGTPLLSFKPEAASPAYVARWPVEGLPQTGKYFDYLAKTSSRPALAPYPSAERRKDFTDVFGDNFTMLDARLVRFIAQLK